MKKWICLIALLLAVLCVTPAMAQYVVYITPTPQVIPELQLKPSTDEVKAYKNPSLSSQLVGYIIVGGRQEVQVLAMQDDWYYVGFTSIYGTSYGWIQASCFEPVPTATPEPVPTPIPTPVTDPNTAYVFNSQSGYRLNLRTEPSASSTSLGKYYTGVPVTLNGRSRNGYQHVTIGTLSGWMDQRYLTGTNLFFEDEMPIVTVDNLRSGVNLRSGPSTSYARIGWYPHGTDVVVLGVRADGWYHVMISGQSGFVSSTLLSDSFPWQYGSDSDNPAVTGALSGAVNTQYVMAQGANAQLPMYASASHTGRVLGRFYTGTQVTVLSYTRTGWNYVRIGDLEGYMDANYLSITAPEQYGVRCSIENPYGTGLNLRRMPSSTSEIIRLCPNYTQVIVLGDLHDGWCYVQVGEQTGYMMGQRLKQIGPN